MKTRKRENEKKSLITFDAIRIVWLGFLPILLFACASGRQETYQTLVTQFKEAPPSGYYHAEVAKAVPQEEREPSTSDAFLDEVEAKVLKYQKAWEARLKSEAPIVEPFYDFGTPEMQAYRHLSESEADARLAETVNLEMLLALGYEWNPGLKAARDKVSATLQQYPQATYLDNLLRQYNAFTKQLDTKVGPLRHKEMMAMKFPFPDTLALKGQIVTEDVEISLKELEITLRNLVTDIKLAYYDNLFVNEAIQINQENQELLRQMIQIAQAKYRAGIGKYHSVIMAQVELSKLADAVITLESQRETIIARLNTLLNRPPDAPLGTPQPITDQEVTPTLDELYTMALAHRQEIQKQRLAISKMNLMVQMAKRMAYPDATLGASYFEEGMKLSSGTAPMPPTFMTQRALTPENSAMFGRQDAYIHEVEVKVDAMGQMLADMENMTKFAVKQHHFGLDTARRSISLYLETLLPQAQQALEAANIAYQAAEIDFLNFLDAQRTLLMFRLEEQRARRDYRHHLAQLESVVGQVLPKQPLKLGHTSE